MLVFIYIYIYIYIRISSICTSLLCCCRCIPFDVVVSATVTHDSCRS